MMLMTDSLRAGADGGPEHCSAVGLQGGALAAGGAGAHAPPARAQEPRMETQPTHIPVLQVLSSMTFQ